MNLPFTVDEFLAAVAHYNTAIWPGQFVAYGLGILIIGLAVRPVGWMNRIAAGLLSLLWLWVGVVYYLMNCQSIVSGALWFGLTFIVQAILIAVFVAMRGDFGFRFSFNAYGITGALFMLYAMLSYPALASWSGHHYPAVPVFGISPDTLTIFTFGLWLWADAPIPRYLLILPFAWAMIGSVIALAMGLYEDAGLFAAGIIGSLMIIRRELKQTAKRLQVKKAKA